MSMFRASDPESKLGLALERLDSLVNWESIDRTAHKGAFLRVDSAPSADLLNYLGDPHRAYRTVHVAGTKGKGSVTAIVASALSEAGLRVGAYNSPHVEAINERFSLYNTTAMAPRAEGRFVGDDELAGSLVAALEARDLAGARGTIGANSSWFDVLTAAGLHLFAEAGVEWAVVECGLGGARDSTNILGAPVCVLTNVELEHTKILGDTREAIAREKLGILSLDATLVTGIDPARDSVVGAVVAEQAATHGARDVIYVDCGLPSPAWAGEGAATPPAASAAPVVARAGRGLPRDGDPNAIDRHHHHHHLHRWPQQEEGDGRPRSLPPTEVHFEESSFFLANRAIASAVLDALAVRGARSRTPCPDWPEGGRPIGAWLLEVDTDPSSSGGRSAKAQAQVNGGGVAGGAYRMLPGRMERFSVLPAGGAQGDGGSHDLVTVVLDGAHVAESVRAVCHTLHKPAGGVRPVVVLGLGKEKSATSIARALEPVGEQHLVATQPSSDPATAIYAPAATVAEAGRTAGFRSVTERTCPIEAVQTAVELARDQGSWVLIVGSLHLCGAVRPWLRRRQGAAICTSLDTEVAAVGSIAGA